jgi:uncharacterized MAPEG superfamily protein
MIAPILAVLGLFMLQTLLPATFRYLLAGRGVWPRLRVALGPRDSQPELSPLGGRAARALANMNEAMPIFLALALLHAQRPAPDVLAMQGAWLFFLARLLYVPAYLSGVFGLRSALWAVGLAALVMMTVALF